MHRHHIVSLLFALIPTLVVATVAGADEATEITPNDIAAAEQRAVEYFGTLQSDGMASITEYMHPEHLDRFKEMVLPLFELSLTEGEDRQFVDMTFGEDATWDEIQKASGKEFLNNFMKIVEAQTESGISFNSLEVVGSVPEGDMIHVLTRMEVGADGIEMRQMEVLSFLRHGDDWLVGLTGEMEGIARALKARAGRLKQRQEAEEASAPEEG